MIKFLSILLIVFAVSCSTKSKKQATAAVYDEAALKSFVISTKDRTKEKVEACLDSIIKSTAADSAVFQQTAAYLEQPFGDPNSSFRNENLYAALLQAKMKSPWTDSLTKIKTRERLYLLLQNSTGAKANDFVYTTPAGYKKRMYDLKAEFTLLLFYNPECPACKEIKEALVHSASISEKLKNKTLQLLAVYTDRDEMIWLDHLKEMPGAWIHGRDDNEYLYKNSVYDVKAIPTMYLLDKDKKVLLKDCTDVTEIEKIILQH